MVATKEIASELASELALSKEERAKRAASKFLMTQEMAAMRAELKSLKVRSHMHDAHDAHDDDCTWSLVVSPLHLAFTCLHAHARTCAGPATDPFTSGGVSSVERVGTVGVGG